MRKEVKITMLKKLFRLAFTLIGCFAGYGAFALAKFLFSKSRYWPEGGFTLWQQIGIAAVFVIIFGLLFFKLTPTLDRKSKKVAKSIEIDLQHFSTNEIVSGTVGLITGLVLAYLISKIYALINVPYLPIILTIITYLILGYVGAVIATRRGKEIFSSFASGKKGQGSGKGKSKSGEALPKILDTSVIIDGRISDIMRTGFMEGKIVIPDFVLVELRHIADSSDGLKRNRGRRGLDVLNRIQSEFGIEIYNTAGDKSLEEIPEVDVKLLKLAQKINGGVITNDFNLNKVAGINGVKVLNINELANTLKPVVLPGEDMELFLVKEGKEHNQAVAYLDDGTMIVVEDGRRFIGKNISATVTSVLQTSAGRMIFAKPGKKTNV